MSILELRIQELNSKASTCHILNFFDELGQLLIYVS